MTRKRLRQRRHEFRRELGRCGRKLVSLAGGRRRCEKPGQCNGAEVPAEDPRGALHGRGGREIVACDPFRDGGSGGVVSERKEREHRRADPMNFPHHKGSANHETSLEGDAGCERAPREFGGTMIARRDVSGHSTSVAAAMTGIENRIAAGMKFSPSGSGLSWREDAEKRSIFNPPRPQRRHLQRGRAAQDHEQQHERGGKWRSLLSTNIADEGSLRRHQQDRADRGRNEDEGKGQREAEKGGGPRTVEADREQSRNDPGNQRSGAGCKHEDTDDANGHQHGQRDRSKADMCLLIPAEVLELPRRRGNAKGARIARSNWIRKFHSRLRQIAEHVVTFRLDALSSPCHERVEAVRLLLRAEVAVSRASNDALDEQRRLSRTIDRALERLLQRDGHVEITAAMQGDDRSLDPSIERDRFFVGAASAARLAVGGLAADACIDRVPVSPRPSSIA